MAALTVWFSVLPVLCVGRFSRPPLQGLIALLHYFSLLLGFSPVFYTPAKSFPTLTINT